MTGHPADIASGPRLAPTKVKGPRGSLLRELVPSASFQGMSLTPLGLFLGLNLVDEFDKVAFGALFPEIQDYFGVGIGTAVALSSAAGLIGLLLALPLGYLVDRVNRVRLTAFLALLWAAGVALTGLAPTILLLGLGRLMAGLGKTGDSAHKSLLTDYYGPEQRASVFSVHALGNPLGRFIGSLVTAGLAGALVWQAPFLLFATFPVVLAVLVLIRLREPARGSADRRAQGIAGAEAEQAEPPPSLRESWRIAWNVRTLRRLLISVPFIVGPAIVIAPFMSQLYADKFGLGPGVRALLLGVDEPFAVAGLVIGGAFTNRILRDRPGRVVNLVGGAAALTGFTFALAATVPSWPLVVVISVLRAFCMALIAPGLAVVLTMVIAPRIRGFGFSLLTLAAAIGVIPTLFAGALGERYGIELSIVFMSLIFVAGALILGSAGLFVETDIRAAQAQAVAAFDAQKAKESGQAKLLVCRDLDVSYGPVQILFGVDFEVDEGEIIALLGTNGAGKSTLLRAVSGLASAGNGAILFDGEDITHLPAHAHAGKGIVQVNGGRGVFPTLTVAENLKLASWGAEAANETLAEFDAAAVLEDVYRTFPILSRRRNEQAGNLSGGEQQMLALSQAFLSRPKLLMIDELSLGLAPAIVEQLLEIVRRIHANGTTVILVEQSINVALTVAQRAVFMEKGEVRFSGPVAELMERGDILRAVFLKGASAGAPIAVGAKRVVGDGSRPVVLETRGLTKAFGGVHAINGISFTLREGEILGFIGPNGAGKTTLYDIISGFLRPDGGQVHFEGEEVTDLSPDQRALRGLQRSFQDARLFPSLTVFENIAVALERQIEVKSAPLAAMHFRSVKRSEAKTVRRVERLIEVNGLGDLKDKFVGELSTGTRRIVDLACVLATKPKVILLDEPSSGVAQKEAEALGPLLVRIRNETGCAMLVIEHDMPLIRSVSDELIALETGAVVVRGTPEQVIDDPRVIASYLGSDAAALNRSGSFA